jgi:hypothetical protein
MLDYPPSAGALGVFTAAEARASGWTRSALRHAIYKQRLTRVRPGAFWIPRSVPTDPWEAERYRHLIQFAAALRTNPAAVASHCSAAVVHGLTISRLPDIGCLTVPVRFVGDIAAMHLHRTRLSNTDVSTVLGLRVTSPERAIVDIGREHGALAALIAADAALHEGRVTRTSLRRQVQACAGWPGVRAARAAIEFADGRAESPLESASRWKLDGVVAPAEIQPSIFLDGAFLGRVDFLWPEAGVVGEADGMKKYDDGVDVLHREKLRQERLEQAGVVVVRWGRNDLDNVPALAVRLADGFTRARRDPTERRWQWRPRDPVSL